MFFTIDGAYSYGIPLSYHNGPAGGPWGARLLGGHVYQITDPSALLTARQALHDPRYLGYRPDSIVWMIDTGGVRDVTVGTPSVQVLPLSGADGANGPRYDIRVNTSLPAGLLASRSETYGLHWAVTTGANDLVEGALPVGAEVPEPESIYFVIGAALIGISRLLLRRR